MVQLTQSKELCYNFFQCWSQVTESLEQVSTTRYIQLCWTATFTVSAKHGGCFLGNYESYI